MWREKQHWHDIYPLLGDSSEEKKETSDDRYKVTSQALPKKRKHNTTDISRIALGCFRQNTALCEAAEIAYAVWIDSIITTQESSYLFIDHIKFRGAEHKNK